MIAVPPDPAQPASSSIDRKEVEHFDALADRWWDEKGPFRTLHQFNPVRIAYIRDAAARHFGRDVRAERPFAGLRLLDIGCGGGLLCEPLSRLGFDVVGVDAAPRNIEAARRHAHHMGLAIDYRQDAAEVLAQAGEGFDLILAMEVVEHVADPDSFLRDIAGMVRPGGMIIAATLNRTLKSFAFAIVGAEYMLRLLPRGTHDWRKFLSPHEVARPLRQAGLTIGQAVGIHYNPLTGVFRLTDNLDVNYILTADRPA